LLNGPRHGGYRRDAEALVDLGTAGIVDASYYVLYREVLSSDASTQDVGVVTVGHCGQGIGVFGTGFDKGLTIKARTHNGRNRGFGWKTPKTPVILVNNCEAMALTREGGR
jgi:hypothetical protein